MTEKDKEAFEKWFSDDYDTATDAAKDAWQAALEYERKRSERLIEKILEIIKYSGNETIYNWGAPLRKIRSAIEDHQSDNIPLSGEEKV
jgi:hypothetical protein